MKNKHVKSFNELNENKKLNISYEDGLSEFMFEVAGKLGGGLPTDYFNNKELTELENIFRKIYDANTDLSNLLYKKNAPQKDYKSMQLTEYHRFNCTPQQKETLKILHTSD